MSSFVRNNDVVDHMIPPTFSSLDAKTLAEEEMREMSGETRTSDSGNGRSGFRSSLPSIVDISPPDIARRRLRIGAQYRRRM